VTGLAMTDEDRAREITAYLRELQQTEARLAGMPEDADDRGDVEQTVEQIREQLRARGHDGAAPHQRATRRTRPSGEETR
jgi:hypothetical protein